VIITYYVVKTLLEDALSENPPTNDSNQLSELAPVSIRQEERQPLTTAQPQTPAPGPTAQAQAGPNYNPYNPFNDSKMVRQNSDDSSAQYFSIGGGIG
jgi:hypothetical protein